MAAPENCCPEQYFKPIPVKLQEYILFHLYFIKQNGLSKKITIFSALYTLLQTSKEL
jgi:hypothetical protein